MRRIVGSLLGTISLAVAQDYGVQGKVFPLQETSFLEVIMSKLQQMQQDGSLQKKLHQQATLLSQKALTPPAVEGLTETQEERVFFYDPTLMLSTDIKDAQNRILFPKGTVYNPLTQVTWGNAWVFLDGENPQHQHYAQTHPDETIILIKGKPLVLEERLQRPVYFDQGGRLTQKFGIGQVPCRITQEGQRLKIHEFNVHHQQGEKHHEHHP